MKKIEITVELDHSEELFSLLDQMNLLYISYTVNIGDQICNSLSVLVPDEFVDELINHISEEMDLRHKTNMISIIEVEGVVSAVDQDLCRGCGQCVEVCPYGAPELVEVKEGVTVSQIQEALCKGCGACAVACPTGAAAIRHFTDQEVLTMVAAALCE